MAAVTSKPISSLASALAHASNHLKARDAGHAAYSQSLPSAKRPSGLPTPPNSLSPTLPPQKGRSSSIATGMSSLQPIESDIDLHEVEDSPMPLSSAALSGIDAADAITPAMLAKHHLPDILLQNGPLAIRFVLGHLTQTVPGFARIPPAKARRICVAALENRAGGGVDGDVVFEKVGWGRWDARHRDQPPREGTVLEGAEDALSPPSSLSIPYGTRTQTGRKSKSRLHPQSPPLSPNEDQASEDEADNMSLDGAVDARPVPRRIAVIRPPSDDDMTDEEDWESMGPEGLLAGSYEPSFASRRGSHVSSLGRPSLKHSASAQLRPQPRNFSTPGPTPEYVRSMSYSGGIEPFHRIYSSSLSTSLRMQGVQRSIHHQQQACGSTQEREAIEALLKMGSM